MDVDESIRLRRDFLKDSVRKAFNFALADQNRGIPPPPVEKPCPPGAQTLDLPGPECFEEVCRADLLAVFRSRRSSRRFSRDKLSREELAFLLWATQGITERHGASTLRPVPSAGARHAFETYLYLQRVEGIDEGVYRYLPVENRLLFLFFEPGLPRWIGEACLGQGFVGQAAAVFFWSAIPYRAEWRYGPAAHRTLAIDAGHVCQNLYLAVEAIGAGTCAVGAYDQDRVDALLGLDGQDEFVIYLAPVGKKLGDEA